MSETLKNVRANLRRRFSHKDKEMPADDVDSADEETTDIITKEYNTAENDDANPMGRPGTLINRMLSHGNKKTEDQIAREAASAQGAQQTAQTGTTTT